MDLFLLTHVFTKLVFKAMGKNGYDHCQSRTFKSLRDFYCQLLGIHERYMTASNIFIITYTFHVQGRRGSDTLQLPLQGVVLLLTSVLG